MTAVLSDILQFTDYFHAIYCISYFSRPSGTKEKSKGFQMKIKAYILQLLNNNSGKLTFLTITHSFKAYYCSNFFGLFFFIFMQKIKIQIPKKRKKITKVKQTRQKH